MIYVEEKEFNKQLELLNVFANKGCFDLVIWRYPESTATSFIDIALSDSDQFNIEPVTTYEDGTIAKSSGRIPLNDELLRKLINNVSWLRNHCDSLCVYSKGSYEWTVCTVGHEGMGLVKDIEILSSLVEQGFNASETAPDWW
jgi:hypothetical protein